MDREKSIFVNMRYKAILDRVLEDAFRNQRSLNELLMEFDEEAVIKESMELYDRAFPTEAPPAPPQTPPQAPPAAPQQYAPQRGPQPIQQEIIPQASSTGLWEPNAHEHLPPMEMNTFAKWGEQVPVKFKKDCPHQFPDGPRPWNQITYWDILNYFNVELDAPGKPRYKSAWETLSWFMKEKCDTTDQQYGKANYWTIRKLKAVMLEVARRRPPQIKEKPQASQGAYVPDVQATQESMAQYQSEETPF